MAEICRITVTVPAPQAAACTLVARVPVQPGPTQTEEALPPVLTVDPPALLAYRVEILNSHGRSAVLPLRLSPPPVPLPRPSISYARRPLGTGPCWSGQPIAPPAVVELDRLPVGPDGAVVEPAQRKTTSKSGKSSNKKPAAKSQSTVPASTPKPLQITPPAPVEVKLRTPIQTADAGGTIDHTAQMGESYRYTAQRVRAVTLGGHTVEVRSAISPPVTMQMRDIFPPRVPTGLEAVPGGGTAADRSIDLSWSPNTESDLAGYIVYRQEIDAKGEAAGTATRLNPTPVVGPAYRDQTAMSGHRYAYRVTAVDTAGNESAPSDPVREILREQ